MQYIVDCGLHTDAHDIAPAIECPMGHKMLRVAVEKDTRENTREQTWTFETRLFSPHSSRLVSHGSLRDKNEWPPR